MVPVGIVGSVVVEVVPVVGQRLGAASAHSQAENPSPQHLPGEGSKE